MGFKVYLVVFFGKKKLIADYSNYLRENMSITGMHNDEGTWSCPPVVRNYVPPSNNNSNNDKMEDGGWSMSSESKKSKKGNCSFTVA